MLLCAQVRLEKDVVVVEAPVFHGREPVDNGVASYIRLYTVCPDIKLVRDYWSIH